MCLFFCYVYIVFDIGWIFDIVDCKRGLFDEKSDLAENGWGRGHYYDCSRQIENSSH